MVQVIQEESMLSLVEHATTTGRAKQGSEYEQTRRRTGQTASATWHQLEALMAP